MDPKEEEYWVDAQRLRNMTYEVVGVYSANWEARQAEGWVWVENLDVTSYGVSSQIVATMQKNRGKENVTIGHPWSRKDEHPAPFSNRLVGLYIRSDDQPTEDEMVFTLHRDFDRWLDADPDDLFA